MSNISALFPSPIYESFISDKAHTECLDIIEKIEFSKHFSSLGGTHKINKSNSENIFSANAIDEFNLNQAKIDIDIAIKEYCRSLSLLYTPNYSMTSWITEFSYRDYGHIHVHSGDISGVFYIKTNSRDGNLFFQNPNSAMSASRLFFEHQHQIIEAREKKLILFPSWLPHGIQTNNTNDTRISLSFNIFFDLKM